MSETSTTPPPSIERPCRLWPVLAVLTAATMWTVTAEMLPSGLLPAMSRDLGVSESTTGTLVSAWAITIAVVSIPLVRATLRVPRTLLLTVSLASIALMNLLTAVAPDFTTALAGRVMTATAHGLFWALVVSYVASIVTADRLGRALSIVLAGPTIAGLAGLPAAAFLTDLVGWRAVFAGLSAILVLTAAALWLILPHRTASANPAAATGAWDRSARGVLVVTIAGGLVLVGHFAAFTYITALVTGLGGFGSSAIPALLLVFGIAGGLGIAVSGFASDRFPRAAVSATAALLTLGLVLVWLGNGLPAVFIVGLVVWGVAIGAFPPVVQARVLRLSSPAFRPLAGSVVVTASNVGIAAGAALGAITLQHSRTALILAALIATAAGILLVVLHPAAASGRTLRRWRASVGSQPTSRMNASSSSATRQASSDAIQ